MLYKSVQECLLKNKRELIPFIQTASSHEKIKKKNL